MFRSNRSYLIASVLLLLATWLIAPRLLTTDDEVPVGEFTGTVVPFTLAPGEEVTQTFLGSTEIITGIALTTPPYDMAPRVLQVRLANPKGMVARSTTFTVTTKNDHSRIRVALPPTHVRPQQKLLLTVRLVSGTPLTLLKTIENPYPYGRLGNDSTADLIFSVLQPAAMSASSRAGLIAGLVAFAGLLVLQVMPPRWRTPGALALLLLITFLAAPSWWFSLGKWGVGDWDYRFSLDTIYRTTMLQFRQFPLWNPYICGGTAALADPEFSVLTPAFFLELLFGVPMGVRLALYLGLAIASTGVFTLARTLKLSTLASFTAALLATYSSAFLLKAAEGHETIIFAYMWLPWALWAWLRAYRQQTRTLWCGLFLAAIFLQGGMYLLSYLIVGFVLLIGFSGDRKRATIVTLQAGLWAAGVAAIKLVPVMLWLRQFPDRDYVASTQTVFNLVDVYLRRFTHGAWVLPSQNSGWHEYGAYIGYPALALVLIGLSSYATARWVRFSCWAVLVAIAASSLGGVLQPLFNHLPFIPRSNISRLALLAVLGMSLLAGNGIDTLRRRLGSRSLLIPLVIGLVAIDVLSLASVIANQTFVLGPVTPAVAPAQWPVQFTADSHTLDYRGKEYNRDWANTQAGYGTFSFCSVIGPLPGAVLPGKPYLQADRPAQLHTARWSSTKVVVDYQATTPTNITIATAYAPGWQANGQSAENKAGKVGTSVLPGQGRIIFRYRPPGFMLGIAMTLATVVLAFVIL
jgi:hypothetical protein